MASICTGKGSSNAKEKIMNNKVAFENALARQLSENNRDRGQGNMLSTRMQSPIQIIPAKDERPLEQYNSDNNEVLNLHPTANLPFVQKRPPFTTYIHTTRNQIRNEDQWAKGKRRVHDEQNGGEAMVHTDHIEEVHTAAPAQNKHEFSEMDKRIIRLVISKDHEPIEKLVQILKQTIGGTTSEIWDEISRLKREDEEEMNQNGMNLNKSLASHLQTYQTLFCRRCYVFDCNLHGIGQPVITPAERSEDRVLGFEHDDEPCSDQCYKNSYEDSICADQDIITWKRLEKDLYLKGVEIFGRNSCLIANLLHGMKTCMEVYTYMHNEGATGSSTSIDPKEQENLARLASSERKGKGKGKKGVGRWRRIADGNQQLNKQYTPCQCTSTCGKDCPCFNNSTCCEKYCGCSKGCKNRFRGCHCAKSQCRSRQCPCFAANRECDPDICRNCWVSCGGGSLGEPQRRGEGQCGNMKHLLGQHQRILLGISDVAGWGVFAKNTIEKDEYIGEYTGELISHEEADKRQLNDRVNSSFLFNLNDEYVIDALRLGNKLKFANHSDNPNCYALIKKVAGDHRIGIYAKRRIEEGEELFFDYCYGPEQLPSWARKPDDPNKGTSAPEARFNNPQPDDPKAGPSVPPQARSKKPQARS